MQSNDTNSTNNVKPKNILKKLTHDRNFTIIDNSLLRNSKLSMKAKGLACYLLSLPQDWTIIIGELAEHFTDGPAAIKSAMKELRVTGYAATFAHRDQRGRVIGWQTLIREDLSIPFPKPGTPEAHYPEVENPPLGTPGANYPEVDFQQVDNQQVDNRSLLSTNDTKDVSNEGLSIALSEKAPGELIKNNKIGKEQIEQIFDRIWEIYPLKKSKQKALQSFSKAISKTSTDKAHLLIEAIIRGLHAYLNERGAMNQLKEQGAKIFVPEMPYLATWINQKRWADEYQAPEQILTLANSASNDRLDLDGFRRNIQEMEKLVEGAI